MPPTFRELQFRNFKGGVNTRDNPSEINPDEMPDAMNVTLDERGGLQKRLGYTDRFGLQVGTGLVSNIFRWTTRDWLVEQIGAGMYVNNGPPFHTWTTSDRASMTEFLGNLVMVHPVDGIRVYDGTTVTTPAGSVAGNAVATWQNRYWVAQINSPRIWYSDIGAVTIGGSNWVDIREKDSDEIVCMAGAGGLDEVGRPGILLFKKGSAYRIYDSNTGAYNTIDPSHGAASNISAISIFGRTYVINTDGIFSTDGLAPLRLESALIENFFHEDQINVTRPDLFSAGRRHNRLYFSVPRAAETANGVALEYSPEQGWIMPHSNAASAYASIGGQSEEMVFGSPTVNGRIYNSHNGGNDNGAVIESRFQTHWMEPNGGNKVRIRRARFVGIGAFDATLLRDFQVSQSGLLLPVNISSDAGIYDDGDLYDTGVPYGPNKFQSYQDFWSLGVYRQISILVTESSSLIKEGRQIISGDVTPEQGAWTLAYASLLSVDLGFH